MNRFILLLLYSVLFAQDLQLKQIVISSGAVQSDRLKGTLGQSVIGTTISDNYILSVGFWGSIAQIFLDVDDVVVPTEYSISKAYPNPFNPVTTIQYGLPVDAAVNIIVYDLQGRIAAELTNEFKSAGYYTLHWDASDHSSGIYFVKMMTSEFTKTQKLMLVK